MDCPNCGLINPETALKCDCGHEFPTGLASQSQNRRGRAVLSPSRFLRVAAGVTAVILFVTDATLVLQHTRAKEIHFYTLGSNVFFALLLLIIVAIVSLPGLGLAYIGCYAVRSFEPVLVRNLFRATFIALFVTPTYYGHAGPMPALLAVAVADPSTRPIHMISIVIVWIGAFTAMEVYARHSARARPGFEKKSSG
jgi:hypothetical protein